MSSKHCSRFTLLWLFCAIRCFITIESLCRDSWLDICLYVITWYFLQRFIRKGFLMSRPLFLCLLDVWLSTLTQVIILETVGTINLMSLDWLLPHISIREFSSCSTCWDLLASFLELVEISKKYSWSNCLSSWVKVTNGFSILTTFHRLLLVK